MYGRLQHLSEEREASKVPTKTCGQQVDKSERRWIYKKMDRTRPARLVVRTHAMIAAIRSCPSYPTVGDPCLNDAEECGPRDLQK